MGRGSDRCPGLAISNLKGRTMKFIITTTSTKGNQMKRTVSLTSLMPMLNAWLNDDTSKTIKIEKPRAR